MKTITKEQAMALLSVDNVSIIQRISLGDIPVSIPRAQAESDFIDHGSGFVDLTEHHREDGMKIGFKLDDGVGRKFICLAS